MTTGVSYIIKELTSDGTGFKTNRFWSESNPIATYNTTESLPVVTTEMAKEYEGNNKEIIYQRVLTTQFFKADLLIFPLWDAPSNRLMVFKASSSRMKRIISSRSMYLPNKTFKTLIN